MNLSENIAAFTNAIGSENPDVVFGLANIDWNSEDDRNSFIHELVKLNNNQRIG